MHDSQAYNLGFWREECDWAPDNEWEANKIDNEWEANKTNKTWANKT